MTFMLKFHFRLNSFVLLVCLFFMTNASGQEVIASDDLSIWFNHPALNWNEALPVGNGQLGAMIFGGVQNEKLQLNEKSIWSGRDEDFVNPEARKALPLVRQLLFEGKYAEAQKLAQDKMMGNKKTGSSYQTMGDLDISFNRNQPFYHYKRDLDLSTAVARVQYQQGEVHYRREMFSSARDHVLVVRLTADKAAMLSFSLSLSREGNKADVQISGTEITMQEKVGSGAGVKFVCRVKVIPEGGRVANTKEQLNITGANAVTILISAATDYTGTDPEVISRKYIDDAAAQDYDTLLAKHIRDYQSWFKRVDLDLGKTSAIYFPTDARLNAFRQGNDDPQLLTLYYQFGRYLLISSSRPGGLPANLQGLWAEGLNPPWDADYHININIQMNYWPAETTNLSGLHQPFLDYIDAMRKDARKTAQDMYGIRGTVAHFTSDAWYFTEPYGQTQWAMWPMGMAWCSRHFWEHYLFTGDKIFLKDQGYPVMKEAAEFCAAWLVKNPRTGKLVSGPSISPENTFKTKTGEVATMVMGPTMDHMIIRDLLTNTIAAAKILQVDEPLQKKLSKALNDLSPTQLTKDGRVMEWTEEFEEPEPGHRHISHLYGLHPGNEITQQKNAPLLAAARKTIAHRLAHGGGHTGWSKAWIINFYARLHDGDEAFQHLSSLLKKSTLPNLFDNHPPFQIDGNFGATAGITEMLLQSHAGEIEILPALPAAWKKGHVHGICARGGFDVNIDWQDGKATRIEILSRLGESCTLRYSDKKINLTTKKGERLTLDGQLNIVR
jgi:alpha-L-fucosidase 2